MVNGGEQNPELDKIHGGRVAENLQNHGYKMMGNRGRQLEDRKFTSAFGPSVFGFIISSRSPLPSGCFLDGKVLPSPKIALSGFAWFFEVFNCGICFA
jgi:hypothetical protein